MVLDRFCHDIRANSCLCVNSTAQQLFGGFKGKAAPNGLHQDYLTEGLKRIQQLISEMRDKVGNM